MSAGIDDSLRYHAERARERFADACDQINRTFGEANRLYSGYHAKALFRAAREAAESASEEWRREGLLTKRLDPATHPATVLFDELATDVSRITRVNLAVDIPRLRSEARQVLSEGLQLASARSSIIDERRGRRRKPEWNEWIAELAAAASDGEINGGMTDTALIELVAERMAARGLDEMPRATIQGAAAKVLERFRSEGI